MRTWAPLWSMIVDSSLWSEPDYVCKIFVTMLALKDSDDVCRINAYQLAQRSRKTEQEVLDALRILSSPDRKRIEPQEFDGRRIQMHEDGWTILNGPKYREMMSAEMKRARDRRSQRAKRERDKLLNRPKPGKPLPGETSAVKLYEMGATDQDGQPIQPETTNEENDGMPANL